MRTILRRYRFLLVAASLVLTISLTANANSVKVSGFSDMGNLNLDLSVRAGLLSVFWTAPDDVGPPNLGFGTVGVPMTLSFGFGGEVGPGFNEVTIGNQVSFTDIVDAAFMFKSSLFTVTALTLANGTMTIPVTLLGGVQVFQNLTPDQVGFLKGPLIAASQFSGRGTATLQLLEAGDGAFSILSANVQFNRINGTLTTTPEPASLLLFGTGLSGIALMWKRRRDAAQSRRTTKERTA